MVAGAIKSLKERGGSSLQAIKKYISANYKVDSVEKLAPFIKKYLKTAVASGDLVQTKGKGASGSFKLRSVAKPDKAPVAASKRAAVAPASAKAKKAAGARAAVAKKRGGAVAAASSPAKKAAGGRKAAGASAAASAAAAKKAKKAPSKVKKVAKAPTKKPKAPKPKKVSAPSKSRSSAKKVAPKKK